MKIIVGRGLAPDAFSRPMMRFFMTSFREGGVALFVTLALATSPKVRGNLRREQAPALRCGNAVRTNPRSTETNVLLFAPRLCGSRVLQVNYTIKCNTWKKEKTHTANLL